MSKILKSLRGKLIAGLVTVVPVVITISVIRILFDFFSSPAVPFLNRVLSMDISPRVIPLIAFVTTLVLLILLGFLTTNILGRKLVQLGEVILKRIPVANTIYGTAKQITQAFSGGSNRGFQKTILISYPHKDSWTLAFVTGESKDQNGKEYYHVFVSTAPNPTSGYMLIIPKDEAIEANMTVEEGMKAIISGGMLAPESNQIASRQKK